MQRRSMIQIVSLGALASRALLAQHAGHCAVETAPAPYKLRFFTAEEHALLEQLMELIIPADQHSPGAREARAADFADWMVSHSSADVQQSWRAGLTQVTPKNLPAIAAHETSPQSDLDRFFVRLKHMTVDGYYTSEVGIHKDLGYVGNQYLLKFEGCTHPEHRG